MMKKVTTAAIRTATGGLHRGAEHKDIKAKGERGFILSDGQFVNRETAAQVAVAAGQVPKNTKTLHAHQLLKGAKSKAK